MSLCRATMAKMMMVVMTAKEMSTSNLGSFGYTQRIGTALRDENNGCKGVRACVWCTIQTNGQKTKRIEHEHFLKNLMTLRTLGSQHTNFKWFNTMLPMYYTLYIMCSSILCPIEIWHAQHHHTQISFDLIVSNNLVPFLCKFWAIAIPFLLFDLYFVLVLYFLVCVREPNISHSLIMMLSILFYILYTHKKNRNVCKNLL